jgi:hypothetical protein
MFVAAEITPEQHINENCIIVVGNMAAQKVALCLRLHQPISWRASY